MEKATIAFLAMSKGDKEIMRTETKGCVLDIHFGGETHFDLRYFIVMEKSGTNKCQSKNSTAATPFACVSITKEHAFYSSCSSGGQTDVATSSRYLY
jgi:hypothetical protein